MNKVIIIFFIFLSNLVLALDFKDLNIKTDNISGEFREVMILNGFDEEIESFGEFKIKNKELFWTIKKPLENSIKITEQGIFFLSNNKWEKQKNSLMDRELFLAVMQLDFKRLQKDFEISLQGDKLNWQLNLRPKSKLLKEIFKNISIKGGQIVYDIEIINAQNDITKTWFKNVK